MTIQFSPSVFNGVSIYEKVIKNPSSIIETIESIASSDSTLRQQWNRAVVTTEDGISEIQDARTNMSMNLGVQLKDPDLSSVALNSINSELHFIFSNCIRHYAEQFCFDINTNKSTNYTVLKYSTGQQYIHHLDHSIQTPRVVSAVGYLNDGYVGGELNFNKINFTYKPQAGDIVVFNSDEPYSHASLPVIDGVKYSVVNWW